MKKYPKDKLKTKFILTVTRKEKTRIIIKTAKCIAIDGREIPVLKEGINRRKMKQRVVDKNSFGTSPRSTDI